MNCRRTAGIATTALIVVAGLAGCAGQTAAPAAPPGHAGAHASAPAGAPAGEGVPDGVAEQYRVLEEEIGAEGGETVSGAWRIAYIVEPAEPWFADHTPASYRPPAPGETHHIEIIPFEEQTGRVVPDVPIRLEILDGTGAVVEAKDLISLYGEFFHYANNFAIPADGKYTLRAMVQPPTFGRHGEQADGPKLADGATVEFTDVELVAEG